LPRLIGAKSIRPIGGLRGLREGSGIASEIQREGDFQDAFPSLGIERVRIALLDFAEPRLTPVNVSPTSSTQNCCFVDVVDLRSLLLSI
jgi:hypothetical protein